MDIPPNSSTSVDSSSSGVLVIVYWLVVGIPLAWGVFQTAQKSIPLFHVTSAPAPAAAANPGATATPPEK